MAASLFKRLASKTLLGVSATAGLAVGLACNRDAAQGAHQSFLRAFYGLPHAYSFPQLASDRKSTRKSLSLEIYGKVKDLLTPDGSMINRGVLKCFEDPSRPFIPKQGNDEDGEGSNKDMIVPPFHSELEDQTCYGYNVNTIDMAADKVLETNDNFKDSDVNSTSIKKMKIINALLPSINTPVLPFLRRVNFIPREEREPMKEEPMPTFPTWIDTDYLASLNDKPVGYNLNPFIEKLQSAFNGVRNYFMSGNSGIFRSKHACSLVQCSSRLDKDVRIGVVVNLPKLSKDKRFNSILKNLCLRKYRRVGSKLKTARGVKGAIEITNLYHPRSQKDDIRQRVLEGARVLMDLEEKLQNGEKIDDLLPIVT